MRLCERSHDWYSRCICLVLNSWGNVMANLNKGGYPLGLERWSLIESSPMSSLWWETWSVWHKIRFPKGKGRALKFTCTTIQLPHQMQAQALSGGTRVSPRAILQCKDSAKLRITRFIKDVSILSVNLTRLVLLPPTQPCLPWLKRIRLSVWTKYSTAWRTEMLISAYNQLKN